MIQTLVSLPDPLKVLLLIGVTFLVTQLLKLLGTAIGTDLSGYTAQIASAIVASILVLVDVLLAKIPSGYESIAGAVLNLIVVLLGSWGAYVFYRTIAPKIVAKKK